MTRFPGAVAVALVLAASTGACTDGSSGDVASFCAAVQSLADDDPFAELEIASPQEMRTAFDRLRDGVADIADAAPDDLDGRSGRYLESVDELIDQLRGAGFDPRDLDTLDYRSATSEYEEAAVSIENAAADACD